MSKLNFKYIFPLVVLTIIGLFVFWKTFQLEIYGDEWEGIWWTTSTLQQKGHFNDRVDYKPYEAAAGLLNLVSGAYSLSYNSTQVYVFSFLTRLFAVFCLYYFLSRRKLSQIAVFIGSLLFLITPIGIQATDWAKNFTSYISIGFFLLCLDSIYNLTTWRRILIFLATFLLSVYINPIRSPGIIFTIIFLLIIQFLFQPKNRRLLSFSLFLILLSFFILSKMSLFGDTNTVQLSYLYNLSLFFSNLSLVKIVDLFIFVGRGILPEPTLSSILLLLFILFYWKRDLLLKRKFLIVLIPVIILSLIVFPLTAEKITALLGFYFTFLIALAFILELVGKRISEAIDTITPLLLNLFFIFIPYFLGRTDVTDSTHRYLIYSALSVPIIVALLLRHFDKKMLFNISIKNLSFYVSLMLIGIFFLSVRTNIDNLYQRHNQALTRTIWAQIRPYFNDFDFEHRRVVIYFDADDEGVLHDAISFGFGYHMGFIYKIWDYDRLPIAVDSKKDLLSLISDGKAGQKYIQKEAIFPKEDAFYFKIERMKVTKLPL